MTRHAFLPFQVQDKLLLSACHLLVSLATTVRPVFLISIPAVQKVFNRVTDASAQRLVDKVGAGGPGAGGAEQEGAASHPAHSSSQAKCSLGAPWQGLCARWEARSRCADPRLGGRLLRTGRQLVTCTRV